MTNFKFLFIYKKIFLDNLIILRQHKASLNKIQTRNMKHSICMVSDFFYPNMGGVEGHIFQLAQCLLELGHKVIVITHFYKNRNGVRYMTNGLKVYYLPMVPFYNQCVLPCMYVSCGIIRDILIRENITIVHGHSAFSTLAHEAMFHASILNIKTIFTDHSLFGFADASSILTNKILECSIASCDHVICVSNTCRENTFLRANLEDPRKVSVIPNAVDSSIFTPDPTASPKDRIVIVVVSRLVYRKGTDLLVGIIAEICKKYPDVDFLIAGDGPKRIEIEELRERHKLHSRINLLGSITNHMVRNVLVKGHIFLNTSLTEAFCIAILEAASCGLLVVSTKVGGIPEILPESMMILTEPRVNDLIEKVDLAIKRHKSGDKIDPIQMHNEIKKMYNWRDVAGRTEIVYNRVVKEYKPNQGIVDKLLKFRRCGYFGYYVMAFIYIIDYLVLLLHELLNPADKIDRALDSSEYKKHVTLKNKKQLK